jgi:hypothetical protein
VLDKYRDPLLLAAQDLQDRLYNIICQDIRSYIHQEDLKKDYLIQHTLFLFGQFFAWQVIMRYEIQFFKFQNKSRRLAAIQGEITRTLNNDHPSAGPLFILQGHQKALGEIMIETDHDNQRCCIGYSEFRRRWREDKAFHEWFAHPAQDLETIAKAAPGVNDQRLQRLQNCLVELVRLLDPCDAFVDPKELETVELKGADKVASRASNV